MSAYLSYSQPHAPGALIKYRSISDQGRQDSVLFNPEKPGPPSPAERDLLRAVGLRAGSRAKSDRIEHSAQGHVKKIYGLTVRLVELVLLV